MCPKSTWMIWHCSLKQQNTAESFQTRARQSFPKGTAAKEKIVKIGQGRKAQLKGDERRYSLVQKPGAKAQPNEPLPLQEDAAEASPAAKRAAKTPCEALHVVYVVCGSLTCIL